MMVSLSCLSGLHVCNQNGLFSAIHFFFKYYDLNSNISKPVSCFGVRSPGNYLQGV